ncbi:MAG TPA: hypothetical protein VKU60_01650, partial [Chloroflexota bacterium]|nr:hypothetical protein [Chloroflexota bacterium]
MTDTRPWAPPADEELTWFRPPPVFSDCPRPLDFTLEVAAFAFGVSRALESLYLPLYELRSKLFDGQLYFAAAPSAMSERDLPAQHARMLDSALRFSRDIRGSWERTVRKEMEGYNQFMEGFPPAEASNPEVGGQLHKLKRTRANQWFAFTRAVVVPATLAQQGIGDTPADVALAVLAEAGEVVDSAGRTQLESAI